MRFWRPSLTTQLKDGISFITELTKTTIEATVKHDKTSISFIPHFHHTSTSSIVINAYMLLRRLDARLKNVTAKQRQARWKNVSDCPTTFA